MIEARPSGRRQGWWTLLLCFSAGWLIYQLTTQPALGATIACLNVGVADIKTACWLRLRDTHPPRGRCLFWCYLTWGLLKIVWISYFAIFAGCIGFILVSEAATLGAWWTEPLPKVLASLLTLIVALLLALLCGLRAVVHAGRCPEKVWLDAALHTARRNDVWPPRHFTTNRAAELLGLLAGGWFLVGCLVPLVLASTYFFRLGGVPHGPVLLLWASLVGACGIGTIAGAQRVFTSLQYKMVARAPAECWELREGPPHSRRRPSAEVDLAHGEEGLPWHP